MSMTPIQCRAARAMIGWSQGQLAKAAGVALMTVCDFENGKRIPIANNLRAIERALAEHVGFTPATGKHGAGVRLRN